MTRRFVWSACALLAVSCVGYSQDAGMPGYGAVECHDKPGSIARGCGRELSAQFTEDEGPKKVLRGREVPRGKYPWVVAVARMQPNKQFRVYCGGSVVASTWVLTAAHCKVKIGDYVLVARENLNSKTGTPVKIDRMVASVPRYNSTSKVNDALLLHLNTAVQVKPIPLNEDPALEDSGDTPLTVAGWGTTSYLGSPSSVLLEASISTRMLDGCQSRYSRSDRTIPVTSFCANGEKARRVDEETGDTVADACQGDSGGGAFRHDDSEDTYELVGVVSWGIGCGDDAYPGVYTRSSWISKWIKPVIKKS